ncbi:hypothetical protein SAMN05216218_103263 [Halorientalis regularis]|uniref:Sensory rhodopsin transducer n=1 Tax=Halorientalis regularis TaxID=660518 RepID=A0A1G7I3G7_9EURY|nr:sensory rhodopsin transducer [Halorientalis regularis]SDF07143.1 hypothetical protein SAMN05216218_103263 [Halorientalis regularis]
MSDVEPLSRDRTHSVVDPGGDIPETSHGPPEMESHETVCLLNATEAAAHVAVTVHFQDRDPVGPYEVTVPAERTRHVQFNEFDDPEGPRGVAFASVVESDRPVVCQHTRLPAGRERATVDDGVPGRVIAWAREQLARRPAISDRFGSLIPSSMDTV